MTESQRVRLPLPEATESELVQRIAQAAERTPDPSSRAQRRAAEYRPALADAMNELHAAAVRLAALDQATSELVRLRCATWHNCRVCKSLRHVTNGERVVEESLASQVIDYESSDLDERHKVALRLADAFMMVPGRIDDELAAEARRHFTDSELAEMLLDIIAWTQQKPLVSLALDIPPSTADLTRLDFDGDGHPIIGGALS